MLDAGLHLHRRSHHRRLGDLSVAFSGTREL